MQEALAHVAKQAGKRYPLVINGKKIFTKDAITSHDPAHPKQVIGHFSRGTVQHAEQALKVAQAQVGVSEAQTQSARATVLQRDATLAQARIDLTRTRITSPVNGIVIKRTIEKGQTVAASLQSPELFIIAQNLREMQVEAAIDEADVGRILVSEEKNPDFDGDAYVGLHHPRIS